MCDPGLPGSTSGVRKERSASLVTFCPEKGWDRLHSSERCRFNHAHAPRAVCFPKSFWEAVIFFPLTRPPVDAPSIRFLAVGKIRLENHSKHLFPGPVPSSPAAPCQQLQQPRGEGRRGARRGWTPDAPSFRGSRPHVCQPPTVSALT